MGPRFDNATLDRIVGIGFTQMRFIASTTKELIGKYSLWDDLKQTIYLTSIECYQQGMHPDGNFREIRNTFSRAIYGFFTSNGFRRPKGESYYVRYDCLPLYDNDEAIDNLANNQELLFALKQIVKENHSEDAWTALWSWCNSKQKKPTGLAKKALDILKEEI